MKIMQLSKRKGETGGAPRQAEIMGQPHMLAYINEAERQMLKRAGGAETPGPEGIPAYWTLFNPSSWGDGKGYEGLSSSSSSNNSSSTSNANSQAAASMNSVGVANIGGKVYPGEPANAGNPAILQYNPTANDDNGPSYEVVGALNAAQPPSMATNADGSIYQPTNNPVNIANTLATGDLISTGNDSNMVLPDGNGGYVTIGGTSINGPEKPILTNDGSGNFTSGGGSTVTTGGGSTGTTTTGGGGGGGGGGTSAPPVNQALLDALARRDAALATQMGNIGTAFGFSTDDYYNQLGTDYREGGLSEAFTTAYDDATRGIYDTFKSAGMLTQQGVDDSMGILASAEGGEEGRIDGIVNQYTTANRNFVDDGRSGMEGTLQGFATDTQDIPTIDSQTAQILGYDVAGNSQPFKTPKEQEVVDFFTDFVKRSYDPSYNVDPTAVASGGPSRVSGSVDQLGAGTQPSTIAGILDPIAGGSVKVIG